MPRFAWRPDALPGNSTFEVAVFSFLFFEKR